MDIDVQWKYEDYDVKSSKPSLKDFYNTMFGGEKKPLCSHVNIKGCEEAVAVTSWSYEVDPVLYAADGSKRRLAFHGRVRVLLPVWNNSHKAKAVDQRTVANFLSATKTHERGHGMACESLAKAIQNFVEAMPAHIPPATVDAVNKAYHTMVHDFYERSARRADKLFDEPYSKHGGKWKAELDYTAVQDPEEDMDIKGFMMPVRRLPKPAPLLAEPSDLYGAPVSILAQKI